MFKHAYVRGVQNALIQSGHGVFPSENDAAKVADYIADRIQFDPINGQMVPVGTTAKIAEALLDASNYFKAQPGIKFASFMKIASVEDLATLAHVHAMDVMQKAAEGSNIEGGDKGNAEPSSAEGKMDAANRPDGYAADSRGKTEVDTRPGAVGKEETQPAAPSNTPAGDNSLTEQSRTASLSNLIAKLAEGSNYTGGDKGNATPTTAEGKMDAAARPESYAVLPSQGALGAMMALVNGPAVIGKEIPQPVQPGQSPNGTNSVIQHSQKAAAEDPYISLFKKTATEVVQYLPGAFNEDAKIAHIRACMGMTTEEKAHYLTGLQKEAADKTAAAAASAPQTTHYNGRNANQRKVAEDGAMPPFIQAKIDAKKEEGGEKKDDDKDHKKDETKSEEKKEEECKKDEKEASLRDYFRRISATVQA